MLTFLPVRIFYARCENSCVYAYLKLGPRKVSETILIALVRVLDCPTAIQTFLQCGKSLLTVICPYYPLLACVLLLSVNECLL